MHDFFKHILKEDLQVTFTLDFVWIMSFLVSFIFDYSFQFYYFFKFTD